MIVNLSQKYRAGAARYNLHKAAIMLSKLYFAFAVSDGFYLKPVRFSVPLLLEGPVWFFKGYRTTDWRPLHRRYKPLRFMKTKKMASQRADAYSRP